MLSVIAVTLLLALTVITVYLCVLTFCALLFSKKFHPIPKAMRVGIVIPAHNEELVLSATLASITKLNYPREDIKVFVIADNCTDKTSQVAQSFGVSVFERNATLRGKGHALHWFFTCFPDIYRSCDCIFLIDADTVVDANCVQELVSSLSHPDVQVVQAYYAVSNPQASWFAALTYVGFVLFNHLRPAGSSFLGSTAGLRGSGMAFRTPIIQRFGWPCHSLAEDLEFTVRLLHEGIRVDYNPDAIVSSEMPLTTEQADSQRQRWERGRLVVIRAYFGSLLEGVVHRGSIAHLELLLGLITPPLTMLALILIGFFGFFALGWLPAWTGALLIFNFLGITSYVVTGLLLKRTPLSVWRALLMVPGFLLFKVFMYSKLLIGRRDVGWIRTRRNGEMP